MNQRCKICNNTFNYCHSCAITKDIFKNTGYCGKNCYDISMLIQSYRSNVMPAEDAAKGLKEHNADQMTFVQGVAKYVNEIKAKAMPIKESLSLEENTSSFITDKDTELL